MRLLILCAAIALPGSSTAAPPPDSKKAAANPSATKQGCRSANLHRADSPPELKARRLDQLPAGNLTLAVVREVDGCTEPVVVRYGYGLGPDAPPPPRVRPKIYR